MVEDPGDADMQRRRRKLRPLVITMGSRRKEEIEQMFASGLYNAVRSIKRPTTTPMIFLNMNMSRLFSLLDLCPIKLMDISIRLPSALAFRHVPFAAVSDCCDGRTRQA